MVAWEIFVNICGHYALKDKVIQKHKIMSLMYLQLHQTHETL